MALMIFFLSAQKDNLFSSAFKRPSPISIPNYSRSPSKPKENPPYSRILWRQIRGGSITLALENPPPRSTLENAIDEESSLCLYNQTTTQIGTEKLSHLLDQLSTNTNLGLTSAQVLNRQKQYGANRLETPPGKSLLQLIFEQFDDSLVQILLAVAAVSGLFSYMEMRSHVRSTGEPKNILKSFIEPVVILAILVLNAIVGVWQSQQAEGSLEALKKLQPTLATVFRDGEWLDNVDASELVPGDLIRIKVGVLLVNFECVF